MPPKNFACLQCGHCCLNLEDAYSGTVEEEDILLWEKHDRWDIIEWVETYEDSRGRLINDIWFNPRTREEVRRCPWLRKLPGKDKYICRIQDLKPKHCREYPVSKKHAQLTGCKGFK